jgi:hypothetical protein
MINIHLASFTTNWPARSELKFSGQADALQRIFSSRSEAGQRPQINICR